jgi:hypothetical protein
VNARSLGRSGLMAAAIALGAAACGVPSSTASAPPPSATTEEATSSSAASAPPASPTTQAAATTCRTSQLRISLVHSSAAGGTVGGYLTFANTSTEPCSLRGWPTIIGVTAAGATTVAKQVRAAGLPFPDLPGIPTVRLDPGAAALAAVSGGDNPGTATSTCPPSYRTLRVTPPGSTEFVSLSAWIPYADAYLAACSGIEVSMLVPEADAPF